MISHNAESSGSHVLRQVLEFLRTFTQARAASDGVLSADELVPLARLADETGYFDCGKPRVLFAGEFKAGKSTLINALLCGDYAATDILEMTSWVARYWCATRAFCHIVWQDRSTTEVRPGDFRRKCEQRAFTDTELETIDSVDIGIEDAGIPCIVIDCPGIGSTTRANEARLVRSIDEADLVAWVVDVDSIGSMREAGLFRTLSQYGTPAIVVLAKFDLIDTAEEAEIVEYVKNTLAVDSGAIFKTSAKSALDSIARGDSLPAESGIPKLHEYISSLALHRAELRKQAELAHLKRMAELGISLLLSIQDALSTAITAINQFRTIASQITEAVQKQIEAEAERIVKTSMFSGGTATLAEDLGSALKAGKGSLSSEAITGIFQKNLGETYFDDFWRDVLEKVSTSAAQMWKERLQHAHADLSDVCSAFRNRALEEVSAYLTPDAIQANVEAVVNDTIAVSFSTTLGIAAVATAYAAWLGPAAGQISLGMAATGVGLPIALMGAGVAAVLSHMSRRSAENAVEEQVQQILDSYVDHFINGVLRPQFFPRLAGLNGKICDGMVEGFSRSASATLPEGDLDDLLARTQFLHRQVLSTL